MRFAFVSDIHANLQAWRTVWPDTVAHNVDRVICLGDIVGYGPRPAETLTAIYPKVDYFVVGNHDAAVAELCDPSEFTEDAQRMIAWTRGRLNKQAFDFIKKLPYAFQIDAGGFDAVCVHGSMSDPTEFDYVFNEEDARAHWAACEERLSFVGHTHIPSADVLSADGEYTRLPPEVLQIEPDKRYIVNVGSVGMPRDDDFRAVYCIYDTAMHVVSWHRTAYDVEGLKDDIRKLIGTSAQAEYMLASFEAGNNTSVRELLDFTPRGKKKTITVHRRTAPAPAPSPTEETDAAEAESRGDEVKQPRKSRKLRVLWIVLALLGLMLLSFASTAVVMVSRADKRAERRAAVRKRAAARRKAWEESRLAAESRKASVPQAGANRPEPPAGATTTDRATQPTQAVATAGQSTRPVKPDQAGQVLVGGGETWLYRDSAGSPGRDWMKPSYNATGWSSGKEPLGFGDDNKATTLRSRKNHRNPQPYLVAYFRRTFKLENGQWSAAKIKLLRDDGAVVYINGREVLRSNMPAGRIAPATLAAATVGEPDETTYFETMIDGDCFTAGENVIAVSVHQGSATSSDLGFGLELIGYRE